MDVHRPDLTVHVEVREKHAYVHGPAVPGAGGLPVGTGTLSYLMDEYLTEPMDSGYVEYIESYWYPSNFKFEICGRHLATGNVILINNTGATTPRSVVSSQWPMYYQYRDGYNIHTNLSFDLEENSVK